MAFHSVLGDKFLEIAEAGIATAAPKLARMYADMTADALKTGLGFSMTTSALSAMWAEMEKISASPALKSMIRDSALLDAQLGAMASRGAVAELHQKSIAMATPLGQHTLRDQAGSDVSKKYQEQFQAMQKLRAETEVMTSKGYKPMLAEMAKMDAQLGAMASRGAVAELHQKSIAMATPLGQHTLRDVAGSEVEKKYLLQLQAMQKLRAETEAMTSKGYKPMLAEMAKMKVEAEQLMKKQAWAEKVAELGPVGARVAWVGEQFTAARAKMMSMGGEVKAVAGVLGSAFALLRQGVGGTYEGEQMNAAFEHLSRVLANMVAPYIRMITRGVLEIAEFLLGLSPATKKWIGYIAAAAGAFGVLLGVIVAAGTALVVLTSPIGLTILAVLALGAVIYEVLGAQWLGYIAAAAAACGVLSLGVVAVGAAIAFLTSPVGLVIAGLGAVAAIGYYCFDSIVKGAEWMSGAFDSASSAMTEMFGGVGETVMTMLFPLGSLISSIFKFMGSSSFDSANEILQSNKGWMEKVATLLEWLTNVGINAAEAIANAWRKMNNYISVAMAEIAEYYGLVARGTGVALSQEAAMQTPWKMDRSGVDKFFETIKQGARTADNEMAGLMGKVKGSWDKIAEAGKNNKDLHIKYQVGFENLQGTWDRLQIAFAQPRENFEAAMLDKADKIWDAMAGGLDVNVKNPPPAVR